MRWQRAKTWITSPDPAYREKKPARPPDPPGDGPPRLGPRLRGRGLVEPPGAARPARLGGRRPAAAAGRAGGRQGRPGPQGAGLLRRCCCRRPTEVWLRFVDGRPVSARDDRVPGLVLPAAGGARARRRCCWSGTTPLACQQGVRAWVRAHNRRVKAGGQRRAAHRLPAADQEPLAQPDRAQVGPRQAPGRRARPPARRGSEVEERARCRALGGDDEEHLALPREGRLIMHLGSCIRRARAGESAAAPATGRPRPPMSARATSTLQPLICLSPGRRRSPDRDSPGAATPRRIEAIAGVILDEIACPAVCKRVRRNGDSH